MRIIFIIFPISCFHVPRNFMYYVYHLVKTEIIFRGISETYHGFHFYLLTKFFQFIFLIISSSSFYPCRQHQVQQDSPQLRDF